MRAIALTLAACTCLAAPASLLAHPDVASEVNSGTFEPIAFGLPGSRVSIREEGGKRVIESNSIPNHEPGEFPNAGNPNAIRAQDNHFTVPLSPKELPAPAAAATPAFRGPPMLFGVAVNGVAFDPGTAEFWRRDRTSIWREEAIYGGQGHLGLDWSNAHVQPNGAYHYHAVPLGLIKQLHAEKSMVLLGWAADGFPIYGPLAYQDANNAASPVVKMRSSYQLKSGERPAGEAGPGGAYDGKYSADYEFAAGSGDLDELNGRHGVTPEFPKGTYYYVTTAEFPFIGRSHRGTPDPSFRHGPPPGGGGPGGPGRFGPPPGPPPRL